MAVQNHSRTSTPFPFGFDLVDTTPPTIISFPSDIYNTVEIGSSSLSTVWWSNPLAIDNSGAFVSSHSTHEPGHNFPIGSISVTYYFEDESLNQATCNFSVSVEIGKRSTVYDVVNFSEDESVSGNLNW